MERFKAVEKEMKTKAYSKEGLSAAAKLDPKEKEKLEACQFLSSMVEELERQIEAIEAEAESLQVNLRKGKKDNSKAERVAEIERITERHKWHQGKLELILRLLENGSLQTDQVVDLQESIKYYVETSQEADFMEDEDIYEELNLEEEEEAFGINNELDRVSSHDAQSIQDDNQEGDPKGHGGGSTKSKGQSGPEVSGIAARRPSTQMKSPLPALATLHTPFTTTANGTASSNMKPAPPPTRPPGETLKYASAAAAAAVAGDKNGVGIAPLPPPPGVAPSTANAPPGLGPLPASSSSKTSATSPDASQPPSSLHAIQPSTQKGISPTTAPLPNTQASTPSLQSQTQSPLVQPSVPAILSGAKNAPPASTADKAEFAPPPIPKPLSSKQDAQSKPGPDAQEAREQPWPSTSTSTSSSAQPNGNTVKPSKQTTDSHESIYHLPPCLQDLMQSFEVTKSRGGSQTLTPSTQRLLAASHTTRPDSIDADKPRHYRPQTRYNTPSHYPQEPLPVFEDPRLYGRVDTDVLFYVFYYQQGTYRQYLAAKSLKSQSWRFHKQYQTWFQRHDEPKTITEDYEQGTYRFFDYESTWWVSPFFTSSRPVI